MDFRQTLEGYVHSFYMSIIFITAYIFIVLSWLGRIDPSEIMASLKVNERHLS